MYICSTYNNFTEAGAVVCSVEQITAQLTVYMTPAAVLHQEQDGMLAHHVYSFITQGNAIGRTRSMAGILQIITTDCKPD